MFLSFLLCLVVHVQSDALVPAWRDIAADPLLCVHTTVQAPDPGSVTSFHVRTSERPAQTHLIAFHILNLQRRFLKTNAVVFIGKDTSLVFGDGKGEEFVYRYPLTGPHGKDDANVPRLDHRFHKECVDADLSPCVVENGGPSLTPPPLRDVHVDSILRQDQWRIPLTRGVVLVESPDANQNCDTICKKNQYTCDPDAMSLVNTCPDRSVDTRPCTLGPFPGIDTVTGARHVAAHASQAADCQHASPTLKNTCGCVKYPGKH